MPSQETPLSIERARVRDLLRHADLRPLRSRAKTNNAINRYYKPTTKRAKPPSQKKGGLLEICDERNEDTVAPHSIAVAAEVEATEADDDLPDDSQLLAHDPTLTAFAQLGAFRLRCQRSFISLMDHENQYILAEATQSVSLNSPDQSLPGDEIYLGARVLDMIWGVCPNTIQVFTAADDSKNVATDMVVANQECYVMNDLSAIESFKNRPYVAGWPHMRFYAEVPIHSPTGHVIGTYCVVDDKPHDGLDKRGLMALNEISSAIMKHLELVQMQHGLQRAGEMVKGLGLFVDGKSSVQDLWTDSFAEQDHLKTLEERPSVQRTGTARTLSSQSGLHGSDQEVPQFSSAANTTPLSEPKEFITATVKPEAHDVASPALAKSVTSEDGTRTRQRKLSSHGTTPYESIVSAGIGQLFSRASKIIREAIDLDGIIFVDACLRDIAVTAETMLSRNSSPENPRFRGIPETPSKDRTEWIVSEEPETITNGYPTPAASENPIGDPLEAKASRQLSGASDLLGSSGTNLSGRVALPQSTMRALLRKYRQGHIFAFDEHGLIVQGDEKKNQHNHTLDAQQPAALENENEALWARQLLSLCPDARALIFFPLWDPQRDQWFAGSLAWTKDPTRIFQSNDLKYLAAFGSCIMAERSRLDALASDRAKADFISSVSHELRSPLHGVLASAEALQNTSTGFEQDDMIRTITICGEVLLDTMDQILDYAKMSKSTGILTSDMGRSLGRATDRNVNRSSLVDLGDLAETVVEGILVGHQYRKATLDSPIFTDVQKEELSPHLSKFTAGRDNVMIILTIDWQVSWLFDSQIGGWKRILMNLFGNALKYTNVGFVHVSLQAKPVQSTPSSDSRKHITLQIEDSGKGMSREYLKYELYTPFAQEDPLSSGTGLGLSIVRQLVTDLGGSIDIQSEPGLGTTAKVSVPLEPSTESPETGISSVILDTRSKCKGLSLCLLGFDVFPDLSETPTGIISVHARRMIALKSSITTFAVDWFGMDVTTASSLVAADGDILIGLQSQLKLSDKVMKTQPWIVFEDIHREDRRQDYGIFYLPQPIGPHKLARILGLCLEYKSLFHKLPDPEDVPLPEEAAPDTLESASVPPGGVNGQLGDGPNAVSGSNGGLRKKTASPIATIPELSYRQAQSLHAETMIKQLQSTTMEPSKSLKRSKVLLVEDNIINMKILVNYMKRAKQDYITAANGLEALQIYQADSSTIKLVFMDISMPVMDGLTSTRQIRTHEREQNLPRTRIVALTCFSSAEYQRDALLSGIDLFLIKPVPMKTLQPILEMDPDIMDIPG